MKTLMAVLCSIAVLGAVPAGAADPIVADPAALQSLRDQLKTDKKAVVAKNMPLSEAEAKKFWPLYEAYERDMQPIEQRRTLAALDFIGADEKLTDANAKRLVGEISAAESDELKLRSRYFDKIARAISARKAARFMQIETKIEALNRFDQAVRIPLAQ